jgi:hypothetical protein
VYSHSHFYFAVYYLFFCLMVVCGPFSQKDGYHSVSDTGTYRFTGRCHMIDQCQLVLYSGHDFYYGIAGNISQPCLKRFNY